MNCELTLPASLYVPGCSRPLIVHISLKPSGISAASAAGVPGENVQPFRSISSLSGEIGLDGSLPVPIKTASSLSAIATGSMNLIVEPLSMQLSRGDPLSS